MLNDFLAALALVFIFEGIMPFLSPNRWRNLLKAIEGQPDKMLRVIGFMSMSFGVLLLYFVRSL